MAKRLAAGMPAWQRGDRVTKGCQTGFPRVPVIVIYSKRRCCLESCYAGVINTGEEGGIHIQGNWEIALMGMSSRRTRRRGRRPCGAAELEVTGKSLRAYFHIAEEAVLEGLGVITSPVPIGD